MRALTTKVGRLERIPRPALIPCPYCRFDRESRRLSIVGAIFIPSKDRLRACVMCRRCGRHGAGSVEQRNHASVRLGDVRLGAWADDHDAA